MMDMPTLQRCNANWLSTFFHISDTQIAYRGTASYVYSLYANPHFPLHTQYYHPAKDLLAIVPPYSQRPTQYGCFTPPKSTLLYVQIEVHNFFLVFLANVLVQILPLTSLPDSLPRQDAPSENQRAVSSIWLFKSTLPIPTSSQRSCLTTNVAAQNLPCSNNTSSRPVNTISTMP